MKLLYNKSSCFILNTRITLVLRYITPIFHFYIGGLLSLIFSIVVVT